MEPDSAEELRLDINFRAFKLSTASLGNTTRNPKYAMRNMQCACLLTTSKRLTKIYEAMPVQTSLPDIILRRFSLIPYQVC
jgi:hypothetical protein